MNLPLINEIQIIPVKPIDGLMAFCSFLWDGILYIGDVGIHLRPDGQNIRLVFPTRRLANGKQIACVHPIRREVADHITAQVEKKYQELLKKCGEHYEQTFIS